MPAVSGMRMNGVIYLDPRDKYPYLKRKIRGKCVLVCATTKINV